MPRSHRLSAGIFPSSAVGLSPPDSASPLSQPVQRSIPPASSSLPRPLSPCARQAVRMRLGTTCRCTQTGLVTIRLMHRPRLGIDHKPEGEMRKNASRHTEKKRRDTTSAAETRKKKITAAVVAVEQLKPATT